MERGASAPLSFGAASAFGTSSSDAYQFTGRENDGTGLDYYRARYYSPRCRGSYRKIRSVLALVIRIFIVTFMTIRLIWSIPLG